MTDYIQLEHKPDNNLSKANHIEEESYPKQRNHF